MKTTISAISIKLGVEDPTIMLPNKRPELNKITITGNNGIMKIQLDVSCDKSGNYYIEFGNQEYLVYVDKEILYIERK